MMPSAQQPETPGLKGQRSQSESQPHRDYGCGERGEGSTSPSEYKQIIYHLSTRDAEVRHNAYIDRQLVRLRRRYLSTKPDPAAMAAAAEFGARKAAVHANRQRLEQQRAADRKSVERGRRVAKHARHLAAQQRRKAERTALRAAASGNRQNG